MIRNESVNTFQEGLVMDLNPLATPNNVMTSALNATIITFNGNEFALQNDMGNGRVETAALPQGFIPLGTAELGGIIYIVSYNPLIKKCQIGSFPSPERNITTDELGEGNKIITVDQFYNNLSKEEPLVNQSINSPYIKLILSNSELNPGDKYQITCQRNKEWGNNDYISAYGQKIKFDHNLLPRYLKFNVVAISDSGKLTNLNDTLVWQPIEGRDSYYYIRQDKLTLTNRSLDLDEYRNLISSNYNVFNSKTSGRLGILAQLECIDSFEVSWDAIPGSETRTTKTWKFYLYLNWTYDNPSSPDKINLYGVKYVTKINNIENTSGIKIISNYPNKNNCPNTDILNSGNNIIDDDWDNVYYTPYYIDSLQEPDYASNGGITTPRKNDGSDYSFLLWDPIEVTYDTLQPDSTVTLEVTPVMPFGGLEWLKQSFNINLSKLGTGAIDLTEYRYYVEESKITIGWGLDAYPEKNKQISQIDFNFYKISDSVLEWMVNNQDHIDNSRIITQNNQSAWDDGVTVSLLDTAWDYQKQINKQSSYSGHFTETIDSDNLEYGSTYLLEININYNNSEKVIHYYRVLYTQEIFNDYYYSSNDFKDIILQDVINQDKVINGKIVDFDQQTITNLTTINNKQGEEIEYIPSYLREQKSEYSDYTVVNDYYGRVKFKVECESKYKLFSIQSSNISMTEGIDAQESNDAVKESVTNGGVQNPSSNLGDIVSEINWEDPEFDDNAFTGWIRQKLSIPISVLYSNHKETIIQQELIPLVLSNTFILYHGRHNLHRLFLSNELGEYITDNNQDLFPDDTRKVAPLSYYSTVYGLVKEALQNTDVLVILSRTIYSDEGDPFYAAWGKGSFLSSGASSWTDWRCWESGQSEGPKSTMLLYYAILDSNGDPILLTFKSSYPVVSWEGIPQQNECYRLKNWQSNVPPAFQQNNIYPENVLSDAALAPFKRYYKPADCSEVVSLYDWSVVNYYNTFSWAITNKSSIQYSITLNINSNVEVPATIKIKNLQYNNSIQEELSFILQDKVLLDYIITQITSTSATRNFLKLPDGEIVEKSISPKLIYDSSGNILNFIKSYNQSIPVDTESDSPISIVCTNGQLRIKSDKTAQQNQIAAHFREEKQAISITGIDLI